MPPWPMCSRSPYTPTRLPTRPRWFAQSASGAEIEGGFLEKRAAGLLVGKKQRPDLDPQFAVVRAGGVQQRGPLGILYG
jgi:hypothetical protein